MCNVHSSIERLCWCIHRDNVHLCTPIFIQQWIVSMTCKCSQTCNQQMEKCTFVSPMVFYVQYFTHGMFCFHLWQHFFPRDSMWWIENASILVHIFGLWPFLVTISKCTKVVTMSHTGSKKGVHHILEPTDKFWLVHVVLNKTCWHC